MALRNATLPSPIVILPSMSRMVTSPACRSFMLSSAIVKTLLKEFSNLELRMFHQSHNCAAFGCSGPANIVHERAHEKDAAPGGLRSEERRVGKECRSRW